MIKVNERGDGFVFRGATELHMKTLERYFEVTPKDIQWACMQLWMRGLSNRRKD